ncbi:MAG: A/G-specific adenine glycosylase [Eubacteriales bacterium]|nr:A/G-specific adenine glycosylase [Eubacteriales bacterium]
MDTERDGREKADIERDAAGSFGERLLSWYEVNRRHLPWREDTVPYHVWLSEIMLQQTRVEAVRGYYDRFLRELPDIKALADAPEEVYMKLWEGLGYYSRVRNLHRAAQVVMADYGGELPRTAAELKKLPGIGSYTAAAIASIAFGEPVPAVDGNLLRVFARLSAYEENIRLPAAAKAAGVFYRERMPAAKGGEFNQALMDLGACVCLPASQPLCGNCPLREDCRVHKLRPGEELSLPVMPAKKERAIDRMTVFVIHSGDRTAVRKRPARGLLAGMYEFPWAQDWLSPKEADRWLRGQGTEALRIVPLEDARHIFTHREWHMRGYEVWIDSLQEERIPFLLVTAEEIRGRYAVPSAFSSFLARIG